MAKVYEKVGDFGAKISKETTVTVEKATTIKKIREQIEALQEQSDSCLEQIDELNDDISELIKLGVSEE